MGMKSSILLTNTCSEGWSKIWMFQVFIALLLLALISFTASIYRHIATQLIHYKSDVLLGCGSPPGVNDG